jgi:RNA-directed DNA polymerase
VKGEAQTRDKGKSGKLRGSVQKRCRRDGRWLETEGSEGRVRESGRPDSARAGVHARRCRRAGLAGVRASVVARKSLNGDGAKGTQEGGYVPEGRPEEKPAVVPERAKQAGEIWNRWNWVEPSVWTERMLTALEKGVKGGKWFSLVDKIYALTNLQEGFSKVKANEGGAGVDHQTIEMFECHLKENLEKLSQSLKEGSYRPQAIRREWIPKPGSKEKRPLGIPTVRDRVVQAALLNVLEPIFEQDFAEQSYGFRPNRGCKDALRRVDELLKRGNTWVVDADLKSYFDTIPHGLLIKRVEEKVSDGAVIAILEGYLKQEVMEAMKRWTPEGGTPQGAVISQLLSNIYLDPLDHEMRESGIEMVRYADDFVILCKSEAEAMKALAKVREWTGPAGLQLHPEKTRIVDATQKGGFDFLGYHFERNMKWPRPKSLKKFKDTLRRKTKRTNGNSLQVIIEDVNRSIRGWFEYFKHSHRNTLPSMDRWIRMRLRSILRKRHGRNGRGRGSDHQRWPNDFFSKHRLFSLELARAVACRSSLR